MNKRGISFIFVSFLMCTVFILLSVVWSMGINDITLSKNYNEKSKSYYIAEGGIYYAGSTIYSALNIGAEPEAFYTLSNPYTEYKKEHSINLTITKEGLSYRVVSEGIYNGKISKISALISVSGENITYSQMKQS